MEPMKNLCGLIPESLHKRLMEGKSPEMTNGEYLTKILTTYLDQPATAKQAVSYTHLDVYKRQGISLRLIYRLEVKPWDTSDWMSSLARSTTTRTEIIWTASCGMAESGVWAIGSAGFARLWRIP